MMFTSLGPQPFLTSVPVMLVGTYDSDGKPNVMPVAWGGLCCSQPPCLSVSIRKTSWTYRAICERKAFTVSIPDRKLVALADFCGLVSGRTVDKFTALGVTPASGEHVDAPYVSQCPVVMELLLRNTLELGSHVQFVGEIMDLKIRSDCLGEEGLPLLARIDGIQYAPLAKAYYSTGEFIARACAVGRTVRNIRQEGMKNLEI